MDACERVVREVKDKGQERLEGAVRNKTVNKKI